MPSADPAPVIRPATRADLPTLGRLGALLVRTHYDFDTKRFIAPTADTPERYGAFLGTRLDDVDSILLVADLTGTVVGYSYAGVEGYDYMALRGPAGALYDLIVDPAHRGKGIGRLLLDATLRELEARDVPRVVLSTAHQNTVAQQLFAHAGFRPTMIEMTRES